MKNNIILRNPLILILLTLLGLLVVLAIMSMGVVGVGCARIITKY